MRTRSTTDSDGDVVISLLGLRVAVMLVAVALASSAVGCGTQADARARPQVSPRLTARAAPPRGFVRACGSISVGPRRSRVDIAEGDGKLVTCAHARRVGLAFVRDHRSGFRMFGRAWNCYRSRPDGRGWARNCDTLSGGYVDIGIGRRW
jgi:hypothetical protein